MRYQISGKSIDIGESLSEHVKETLTDIVEKYAQRPTNAVIVFSKDRYEFAVEVTVHLSTGLNVNAAGKASDIYGAFALASQKIEKQLRRYKRRLKNHHSVRQTPVEFTGVSSYIIASENGGDSFDEAEEPETLNPAIIAEMETKIKSLSVGEAVMQMELTDSPVLMFNNDASGTLNVVYRRNDGNIGWIDPANIR